MAQTFNCPSCGAPLETNGRESTIHCEYCGETVIVPPELRSAAGTSAESILSPSPESFEVGGPHGNMSSSQVRQMMTSIRSGQLEDAARSFQAGTGANEQTANQTVQMIASQISASNRILPTELAAIMLKFAQSANRNDQSFQPAAASRRRQGGIGCWLLLLFILLVVYFAYTSLSPLNLVTSLLAGNKNDPVLKTAAAPFHQVETALAPAIRQLVTPAPTSANPTHTVLSFGGAGVGQGFLPVHAVLPSTGRGGSTSLITPAGESRFLTVWNNSWRIRPR